MENLGLLLIFWYGILHAFGPDHLTAIADFSIGKNKRKTMFITILFAIGHGIMLFVFAKILETYNINENLLGYGDIISSSVILMMGFYLLYVVYSDKIHLKKHVHEGKEHIHIYFGNEHNHNHHNYNSTDTTSAFTIGALMGIGGVRGMLITLGAIQGQNVDFTLVLAFTSGVMLVFIVFGAIILYINQNLLNNKQNVRKIFATAGVVSVAVGANMLLC
jgi:ABC-type nickel/cobalt efflux system permease component RcnA